MSITHRHEVTVTGNGSRTHRAASVSAQREIVIPDLPLAIGTDQLVKCSFNYADVASILITTDTAITIETNSGSSPSQTFAFPANGQLEWTNLSPLTNPVTANVTALYITNAAAANVTIIILLN